MLDRLTAHCYSSDRGDLMMNRVVWSGIPQILCSLPSLAEKLNSKTIICYFQEIVVKLTKIQSFEVI